MSHGFTRFFTEMGHGFTRFFTVLRWGALGLVLVGCSGGLTPEEAASLAAKGYYRHLADGDCEHFLEGRVGSDSLPELYREQLLTSCRQFVAQQKKLHQGITDVSVSNVRRDTLTDYVSVFLLLKFGDATTEEIVVPMVEHNGKWRMK